MANIFISFSRQDESLGSYIYNAVLQTGHFVIPNDGESKELSDRTRATMLASILPQCDIFLALITKDYLSSPGRLAELDYVNGYSQGNQNFYIVFLKFDDVSVPIADLNRVSYWMIDPSLPHDKIAAIAMNAIGGILAHIDSVKRAFEEIQEKIETNAAQFIDVEINSLKERETVNRTWGTVCNILGFIALLLGAGVAAWGTAAVGGIHEGEWIKFASISIKMLVAISLLIASSKYAFTLGKSYTNEALKNADRIHAISFGRFYLNAFGSKATWDELKEVFQHWNIDKASSFAELDAAQFDPKMLETAIELAKALTAIKK